MSPGLNSFWHSAEQVTIVSRDRYVSCVSVRSPNKCTNTRALDCMQLITLNAHATVIHEDASSHRNILRICSNRNSNARRSSSLYRTATNYVQRAGRYSVFTILCILEFFQRSGTRVSFVNSMIMMVEWLIRFWLFPPHALICYNHIYVFTSY